MDKKELTSIIKQMYADLMLSKIEIINGLAYLICENAYEEVFDENGDFIDYEPAAEINDYMNLTEDSYMTAASIIKQGVSSHILHELYDSWKSVVKILVDEYSYISKKISFKLPLFYSKTAEVFLACDQDSRMLIHDACDFEVISNMQKKVEIDFCTGHEKNMILPYLYHRASADSVDWLGNLTHGMEGLNKSYNRIYIPLLLSTDDFSAAILSDYYYNLEYNGRMVVTVPQTVLKHNRFIAFRKDIMERKELRMIIRLDGKALHPYSNDTFYMLVIDKSYNNSSSFVWLNLDFDKLATDVVRSMQDVNAATVRKLQNSAFTDGVQVQYQSFWSNKAVFFDPTIRRDTSNPPEGFKYVKLDEILSKVRSRSIGYTDKEFPLLNRKSLTNSTYDFTIRPNDFLRGPAKPSYYPLFTEAFCFDRFTFKSGIVEASEQNFILLPDYVSAFELIDKRIYYDYLQYALTLPEVQKEFEDLTEGLSIKRLPVRAFLETQILIPDTDNDSVFKERILSILNTEKDALLQEGQAELRKAYEDFSKDVHMRKHALGQTMFSLSADWAYLRPILEKMIDCSQTVGRKKPMTIARIMDNISNRIAYANKQVDKLTSNEDFGNAEDIEIIGYLVDYMNHNDSTQFSFESNLELPESEDDQVIVHIRPKAFKQVLDNLVSNAVSHAFTQDMKTCLIKIDVQKSRSVCDISVANTGLPVAGNLRNDKLFIGGESSKLGQDGHTGTGCYEARELLKADDASIRLVSHDDDLYVTEFIISIPIAE